MCGISGIWHLDNQQIEKDWLVNFTDSLRHRGPDGAGYWLHQKKHLGLGHRRLAILDLSEKGKQPMSFAEDRYQITYNGEIFNFLELKKELETLGYVFHSATDTEIILAAYHQWGKACLLKFNGMWAFAIWDNQKEKLFISRDRYGIKPLYYLTLPNKLFAIASETIAFKYLNGFKRKVNDSMLALSIVAQKMMESQGYTIYDHIYQLLPGHYIELEKGKKIQQHRWWNTYDHLVKVPTSYEDQMEEFSALFDDACRLRLRSDVPLASALSGGLDSSSVYCNIHQMMKKNDRIERSPDNWQKAFVATFPNTSVDERRFAEQVIEHTKGEVHYITPDYSQLINDIEKSTLLFDGITSTPIIALTDVYKAMHQNGIKVSMDGHGVDEMLFGYKGSVKAAFMDSYLSNDKKVMEDLMDTFIHLYPEQEQEQVREQLIAAAKIHKQAITSKNKIKNTVSSILRKIKPTSSFTSPSNPAWMKKQQQMGSMPNLSDHYLDYMHWSNSKKITHEHFHLTELPYNLRDFDRASMQNSIEIRMPFMDWRLITYVFSLPLSSKIGGGFTKRILRDAMKGILPESIRNRKLKIGLGAPVYEWFSGAMSEYLMDEFNSKKFTEYPLWNGEEIKNEVLEKIKTKSLKPEDCNKIWGLLNAHIIVNK